MLGFTELVTVKASGIVEELSKLRGIDSADVLVEHCGDGNMSVSIATELIDWPHVRASYLTDGVAEYRVLVAASITRQRRTRAQVEADNGGVALPTVTKQRVRGKVEPTTEDVAA